MTQIVKKLKKKCTMQSETDITFAELPNARNAIGEPVTESKCGYYRLLELAGEGFYCHYRNTKKQPWLGVPGQPFRSREEAIRACERVPRYKHKFGHKKVKAK